VRSHDRSQVQVIQICRLSTYCFAAAALVQVCIQRPNRKKWGRRLRCLARLGPVAAASKDNPIGDHSERFFPKPSEPEPFTRPLQAIAIGSIQSPPAIWFHLPFGLFPAADWCDVHLAGNSERREMRADCIRDVRGGQMRIVFFRHPRVGVAELSGDDA
jgi:hypothetical protein